MNSCASFEDHTIEARILAEPHSQFTLTDAEVRFAQLLQDIVEDDFPCTSLEWIVRALDTAAERDELISTQCTTVVSSHLHRMAGILEQLFDHDEAVVESRIQRFEEVVHLLLWLQVFTDVGEVVMARLYCPEGPVFRTLKRRYDSMSRERLSSESPRSSHSGTCTPKDPND